MSIKHRSAICIAGTWTGLLLGVGAVAAPSAFALFPAPQAGQLVGRMLSIQAPLSLLAGVALLLLLRRPRTPGRDIRTTGAVLTVELLLVFAALFCTVAGDYGVRELMVQAKQGQGPWSFMALHVVSTVLFSLKTVCTAYLTWRLTRPLIS